MYIVYDKTETLPYVQSFETRYLAEKFISRVKLTGSNTYKNLSVTTDNMYDRMVENINAQLCTAVGLEW